MHVGHFLTRAALRWPHRPAWPEGDVAVTFREAEARVNRLASGGSNIYPRELEEVICTYPALHEVAVIGAPDLKWGENVKAIVVLRPGARTTEAGIVEHCLRGLASYKKPASVDFVTDLPKNADGKLLKRELREAHWRGQSRNV